jgi:hypothetical protein
VKIEKSEDGKHWTASGAGYFRPIIVEAASRQEARVAFMDRFRIQRKVWMQRQVLS